MVITKEGSQASQDKLVRLVLLIAIRMTTAWLQGEKTSILGNLLILVGKRKQGELNEDIAIFGSVCTATIGELPFMSVRNG